MNNQIDRDNIIQEAKRCLNCKNPRCKQACPISTEVASFIELFLNENEEEAGEMLFKNNPLSSICSLVCPHERQCEGSCVLGIKGRPVKIASIEQYISSNYLNKKACRAEENNLGRVAIIGSGPAGISIAFVLAIKGYDITMYDSHDKIGGVLRYGIPEFRLPKVMLDKLKDKLLEMNVKIRPNTLIGPVITVDDLFRDGFDAVFIGTGVWKPNKLNIPGESLGHVHYAIDYLKSPSAYRLGERVLIIGAGNVAMDAARTAIRNGSKEVKVIYRRGRESMSATNHEIESAINEGVIFDYYKSPISIDDKGLYYRDMNFEASTPTSTNIDGDHTKESPINMLLEADSIIIAISQGPKSNIVSKTRDIETNESGLVVTDRFGHTTKAGVFASGDVVTGARTVVEAVKYSKDVANAIDEYIQNKVR